MVRSKVKNGHSWCSVVICRKRSAFGMQFHLIVVSIFLKTCVKDQGDSSSRLLERRILLLAKRRATRFIISSRAKRACITQASQGQRDFILAINLSSLVGVRLDVIQSSDVKAHYGFRGNRLPSTTKLWVLFIKTGFFICEL